MTLRQKLIDGGRSLLYGIGGFVKGEQAKPFLKVVFTKDIRVSKIQGYQRQIAQFAEGFKVLDSLPCSLATETDNIISVLHHSANVPFEDQRMAGTTRASVPNRQG
jgi:hypothetical protein